MAPATGTALLLIASGDHGPLSHTTAPGSAPQSLLQEIPFYLELAYLLVELEDEDFGILFAAGFTAKDTGGPSSRAFFQERIWLG